jgi:hypothetical protein
MPLPLSSSVVDAPFRGSDTSYGVGIALVLYDDKEDEVAFLRTLAI